MILVTSEHQEMKDTRTSQFLRKSKLWCALCVPASSCAPATCHTVLYFRSWARQCCYSCSSCDRGCYLHDLWLVQRKDENDQSKHRPVSQNTNTSLDHCISLHRALEGEGWDFPNDQKCSKWLIWKQATKPNKSTLVQIRSVRTKSNFVWLSGLRPVFVIGATGGSISSGNRSFLHGTVYLLPVSLYWLEPP